MVKLNHLKMKKCLVDQFHIMERLNYLQLNILIKLHKKKAFPFTVVRLYQVYGPGQETNRIIPFAIKSAKNNKTFPCSSGTQKEIYLRR